jgi:hypothetical protein
MVKRASRPVVAIHPTFEDEQVVAELRARSDGRPLAVLIRRALRLYLEHLRDRERAAAAEGTELQAAAR